jgi:hypothetical protein
MIDVVKHYMWKAGESDNSPIGEKDLETRFPGIKYSKCDGLNSKGKRKNVHTEKYADSGELRVWQDPNRVIREATTITFTFYFTGTDRQAEYDKFIEYISNGKINYWDTVRKKHACMIFIDQADPKEDMYKGSVPYILAELKMQNIWGECPTKEATEF